MAAPGHRIDPLHLAFAAMRRQASRWTRLAVDKCSLSDDRGSALTVGDISAACSHCHNSDVAGNVSTDSG